MTRALETVKWIAAFLGVLLFIATAPVWGPFWVVWRIIGPMVVDMKRVIDGEIKLW